VISSARAGSAAARCIAALAALAWVATAHGLSVRGEFVAGGAAAPIEVQHAGDGSPRLFVAEQGGTIRILRNGTLLPTPFLDVRGLVAQGGERGLLGLAFHPHYATNGIFFVNYTRVGDGASVIAAWRVDPANPDRADPSSRRELMSIAQPFENHNGGALRFGPDGYLYIGLGDGGSGNDPGNRAQDPQELLGKMLRIDVDGAAPYAVPPGNAFPAGGGRPRFGRTACPNRWPSPLDAGRGDF